MYTERLKFRFQSWNSASKQNPTQYWALQSWQKINDQTAKFAGK